MVVEEGLELNRAHASSMSGEESFGFVQRKDSSHSVVEVSKRYNTSEK